jgi:hypothetical protein
MRKEPVGDMVDVDFDDLWLRGGVDVAELPCRVDVEGRTTGVAIAFVVCGATAHVPERFMRVRVRLDDPREYWEEV